VPQPSDSPNDPMNWPEWQKNTIIIVLAFASAITVSLAPMLGPGFVEIFKLYHVNLNAISTYMIGMLLLMTGLGTFFTSAAATIWGKRPVFIVSVFILLITNIWGFMATSFLSLQLMRVVQGLASAPLETLVTSAVSDVFFVHQRGKRLGIWGLMVYSGIALGLVHLRSFTPE
jgi:MFS family permease